MTIHPFFFAIFPILFLYSENINEVFLYETIAPVLFVGASILGLFLILRGILSDSKKAAIILSSLLIFFFSYGHVAELVRGDNVESILVSGYVVFPILFGLFLLVAIWTLRTKRNLDNMTNLLNFVSAILVVISLLSVVTYLAGSSTQQVTRTNIEEFKLQSRGDSQSNLPDIYYLVFDRYSGNEVLSEFYVYDNTDFTDYLEDKGFYVAKESYSNYPKTGHSLASSLNMEYINYLADELGTNSDNFLPLYEKLDDYKVWHFLKERGYTFIHFGSFWAHTERNRFADVNYNLYSLPEFSQLVYETTALHPFGIKLSLFDANLTQYRRVNYKFEKLREIPEISGPTFVFDHFIIPHDPYVFDREGNYQTREQIALKSDTEGYIDQLIFVNSQIRNLVETILADTNTSIIIIQGDEGVVTGRYLEALKAGSYGFDWRQATPEELKQKLSILNAIYLPDTNYDSLYPTISPVNTFRLVFNKYFEGDFELLDDKHYVFSFEEKPYDFQEVSELIRVVN